MILELCGYFDNNFGDDYMQKIAAHYMPEYDFYVDEHNSPSPLLLAEKNVSLSSGGQQEKAPKLLVTGSGFMVNSRAALICELVWFFRRKHIADYCIGCNIEPFRSVIAERLVAHKLRKFKYIICRDRKSLLWLRKKCPKTAVEYMPDILFGIPGHWLPKKSGGDKLGISLIRHDGDNEVYCRKMAQIADFWIETTGKSVLLLALDVGTEDDITLCERVKSLMMHKDEAEIVRHGINGEIPKAFSECCKIIGARFHSAVLSLKMNIEFYPIVYRRKMQNLISDIGYPVKGCCIHSVDTEKLKSFLTSEPVGFRLDERYESEVRRSFDVLKTQIKEREKR